MQALFSALFSLLSLSLFLEVQSYQLSAHHQESLPLEGRRGGLGSEEERMQAREGVMCKSCETRPASLWNAATEEGKIVSHTPQGEPDEAGTHWEQSVEIKNMRESASRL